LDGTVAFAATSAVAELGGPSRVHLRVAAEAITASVHGTLDIHDYGPYTQAFDTMLLSTTVALPVRFGMAELAPYVATGELTNSPIGGRSYVVAGLALVVTPTPRVF
jgi:hypothetical protein